MKNISNESTVSAADFFKSVHQQNTLLISDFDGTIYRGLLPFIFRGISNAELGIFLCLLHLFSPGKLFQLVYSLTRLFFLERKHRRQYKAGQISLSEMEDTLIRFFAGHLLRKCSPAKITRAARLTGPFLYRYMEKVLGLLAEHIYKIVIISKSFAPVLEVFQKKITQTLHINVEWFGVNVKPSSTWEIDRENSILSRRDKFTCVKQMLADHKNIEKVIIIGDTEDDIALAQGAVRLIGEDNVFFIAVNARDNRIKTAAHLDCKNWKRLFEFLKKSCG